MSVLYNVMQVAGWSVKHDVVQDLKIGSAHQKWSMTEARQSMNPPEEPQQKSSWDHHTLPQAPPPEQGKPPRHTDRPEGNQTGASNLLSREGRLHPGDISGGLLARAEAADSESAHLPTIVCPFSHWSCCSSWWTGAPVRRSWRGEQSWKRQF